jgi:hypothetical protein
VAAADSALAAAPAAGVQVHTHLGPIKKPPSASPGPGIYPPGHRHRWVSLHRQPQTPTDFVTVLVAILGHRKTALSTHSHKETPMATKDTPAATTAQPPRRPRPRKSYLPPPDRVQTTPTGGTSHKHAKRAGGHLDGDGFGHKDSGEAGGARGGRGSKGSRGGRGSEGEMQRKSLFNSSPASPYSLISPSFPRNSFHEEETDRPKRSM